MLPKLEDILFIDIETVPQTESLELLPENIQALWISKANNLRLKRQTESEVSPLFDNDFYFDNAAIYSEFSKIICISIGAFYKSNGQILFRIKSFFDSDEKKLLVGFLSAFSNFFKRSDHRICGHNIKEFDVPCICRRTLINGLTIPNYLNVAGKKPWETPFLDTLELWRFGDYKNYTSLKTLTTILGIPTPKDDIDGSDVARIFYKEKDIDRIVTYCQKDVLATARLYQRFNNIPCIDDRFVELP